MPPAILTPAAALAVIFVDSAAQAAKGWSYVLFPSLAGNASGSFDAEDASSATASSSTS